MDDLVTRIMEGSERLRNLEDIDEVVKHLARLLKRLVKSRWVAVYFFDRERRDFAPAHSAGLPPRYEPLFRTLPLAPGKIPLLKGMLKRKQHLLIVDTAGSELLSPLFRRFLRDVVLLAVPMAVRNQVIGAVFLARPRNLAPFTPEEIVIIREMVGQAALVVSHMRLFDETLDMAVDLAGRIDVILTIDEINKAISSSLSRDRIMATAMEQIERLTRCELVAVVQPEGERLVVTASHSTGMVVPETLLPGAEVTGRALAAIAFSRRESRYVPRLRNGTRLAPIDRQLAEAGIESLYAIPLMSKEKISGVLLLGDTEPAQFTREAAFTIEKIASQMAVALENARLYEELHTLFISTVSSLANAIDAKSPWTKGHSERVMRLSASIARELGLSEPEVERIRLGGLLHDIGKIGIIEALLEKPERLSEDEFPPMRLHPEKGVAILAPIEQLKDVLPGILHHHERFDGAGYPGGLVGTAIPLAARVIAVADSFDAMVADRPYKKGYSVQEAMDELVRCAGRQFDPEVVARFADILRRNLDNVRPRAAREQQKGRR